MRASHTADLWWKNAIFYCLDVERYQDSNGDGIGDFPGLTSRVEHLAKLGVSCIWLMPFYPTPKHDDGYDISDYYGIDPRLGTFGDFVETMRTAQSHGIRIIADLVVNHTSDQHPWFLESKSSKSNPKRNWYIWADEPEEEPAEGVMFPDREDSIWTRDGRTRQYFRHRFLSKQPDLNIDNPEVRDEIARIMGFWMQLGLSGFRVDAVPYLMDTNGTFDPSDLPESHGYLADLASFMRRRRGDAIMLGEVNLAHDHARHYFGDHGQELSLAFDFATNQSMFHALATHDATGLATTISQRPSPPGHGQWATFVRSHDELTLDQLTDEQRDAVFEALGPDEDMQVFGRGLRRRLPPMVGGDNQRLRMVYSLLFSLPGAPVLYYGEEVAMGENLELPGRLAVRTPMQWSPGLNAGFSDAEPGELVCPLTTGTFGPQEHNVESYETDPDSLLHWITLLIRRRRERPEFGWGTSTILDTSDPAVLAIQMSWYDSHVIGVHNLADRPIEVSLRPQDLASDASLEDLLAEGTGRPVLVAREADGTVSLMLERYECRWLH